VLFAAFLITDFPSLPLPIDPWPSVSIRGRVFPDPRSSAQIRGKGFGFPITADFGGLY
jgi:hypothetical protein